MSRSQQKFNIESQETRKQSFIGSSWRFLEKIAGIAIISSALLVIISGTALICSHSPRLAASLASLDESRRAAFSLAKNALGNLQTATYFVKIENYLIHSASRVIAKTETTFSNIKIPGITVPELSFGKHSGEFNKPLASLAESRRASRALVETPAFDPQTFVENYQEKMGKVLTALSPDKPVRLSEPKVAGAEKTVTSQSKITIPPLPPDAWKYLLLIGSAITIAFLIFWFFYSIHRVFLQPVGMFGWIGLIIFFLISSLTLNQFIRQTVAPEINNNIQFNNPFASNSNFNSNSKNGVQISGGKQTQEALVTASELKDRLLAYVLKDSLQKNQTLTPIPLEFRNQDFEWKNQEINLAKDSIDSREIARHAIQAEDIDTDSITSRTIRNHTIQGEDIDPNTDINVADILSGQITAETLTLTDQATIPILNITDEIDLGTNTIYDGNFTGDWNWNGGDLTTTGNITTGTLTAGATTFSGNLDMQNNLVSNIGAPGTDFTTGGGLTLAGNLNVNGIGINYFAKSIFPSVDISVDLGDPTHRFNNLYSANIITAAISTSGQAVFNYQPANTNYAESSVLINPTTAIANAPLLGIGVGGVERLRIDEDGDLTTQGNISGGTYNGQTITTGTGTLTLSTHTLALTGSSDINQNLLTTSSPTFDDLTISGDDLFMATNTANYFLMADGVNFNPTTPADARTGLGIDSGGLGDIWVKRAGDTMTSQLTSTLATGTSPLAVTSTTVNTNLNADLLDGLHSASFLQGNQTITLSGDVTGSGTTAITTTLATVNSTTGSFGSSTAIPTFTVNGKGLITAAGTAAVVAPAGTLTGTTLNATVVTSSLTSVGTLGSLAVTGAITWSGGGSANANTAYSHSTTDADTSATNEIQTLGTSGNTITLTSGGSVTAPYATSAGNADSVDSQHFAWSNADNNPTYLWGANANGSSFLAARGSMSVGYASTAGAAYPYRVGGVVMQMNWSGQGGQPSWLWGGNDGTNFYVYNPSNFSVNYAASAGSAPANGGNADTTDSQHLGTGNNVVFNRLTLRQAGVSLGTGNSAQLEINNAGNGAANISFHREGAYGAHFGLDTDNWFSTYGWSAGGGYTSMRIGSLNASGTITSVGTYNITHDSSPYMRIAPDGLMGRDSSSIRYKTNVRDLTRDIVEISKNLRPVVYNSINNPDGPDFVGFIAEEVDAIGLIPIVGYEADGRPGWLNYDRLTAIFAVRIKDLETQMSELKGVVSVDNLGNIGIGTTNPLAKLEIVDGNIKITNGAIIANGVNLNDQILGLNLSIGENATTLGTLSGLVNSQLNIISGSLNDLQIKDADLQLKIDAINSQIATLNTNYQILNTFQSQMDEIKTQNVEIMSFLSVTEGKIDLMDGTLEAAGVVAGAFTVKTVDAERKTIDTGILPAGETQVEIQTKAIGENSKVFVTAQAENAVMYPLTVTAKTAGVGFTIEIPEILETDLSFDWWIVESQ